MYPNHSAELVGDCSFLTLLLFPVKHLKTAGTDVAKNATPGLSYPRARTHPGFSKSLPPSTKEDADAGLVSRRNWGNEAAFQTHRMLLRLMH